jgi:hypothetical protein
MVDIVKTEPTNANTKLITLEKQGDKWKIVKITDPE